MFRAYMSRFLFRKVAPFVLLSSIPVFVAACGGVSGNSSMIVTPDLPPVILTAAECEDNECEEEFADRLKEFLPLLNELLVLYEPSELIALLKSKIEEIQVSGHTSDGPLPFPIKQGHGISQEPALIWLHFLAGRTRPRGQPPMFFIEAVPGYSTNPDDVLHAPTVISGRSMDDFEPIEHGSIVIVGTEQGIYDWGWIDGEHQTRQGLNALRLVHTSPDLDVRYGRLQDGAGTTLHSFFADYMRSAATEFLGDQRLHYRALRYRETPVVHFIGEPTELELQETIAAMQWVNSGLPESAKLRLGDVLDRADWPREGIIAIDFQDAYDAYNPDGSPQKTSWAENTFNPDGSIKWSYIRIGNESSGPCDSEASCNWRTRQDNTSKVAHEIIHALGIYGHVDAFHFRSLMSESGSGSMWPTDREALRLLYSRLQPGERLPSGFAGWTSDSLHVHGNSPHVGFGVALRNGYAEPWAYGYAPRTFIADNRALSGPVVWSGALLGLTPTGASVRGDTRLLVDLATMAGRADFTSLEAWTDTPGTPGTGDLFGDGSLGYGIAVTGNTFRETSGDPGRLTGSFTGISHEGVAGTLEREDLTAAFGGSR